MIFDVEMSGSVWVVGYGSQSVQVVRSNAHRTDSVGMDRADLGAENFLPCMFADPKLNAGQGDDTDVADHAPDLRVDDREVLSVQVEVDTDSHNAK